MAAPDPLRRLGGGRWETKDGRFTIEPQSGTWVIVDSTQTNEFGLPLVRGPFPSLGAARAAIETARTEGPARSPLEDRIAQGRREAPRESARSTPKSTAKGKKGSKTHAAAPPDGERRPEPEPPPEPAWLRNLTPADRRKAKQLVARLEALGIEHADDIVRAEVAGGQPALARLGLERRLGDIAEAAGDGRAAVRAAMEAILAGKDDDTGARWRLVDGDGRQITTVKLGG
jgi:hypothetical protein